jgi:hypothetical protein
MEKWEQNHGQWDSAVAYAEAEYPKVCMCENNGDYCDYCKAIEDYKLNHPVNDPVFIMESYHAANVILMAARRSQSELTPVWRKIDHAVTYIDKQAAEVLAKVVGE